MRLFLPIVAAASALTGCAFDENLIVEDLRGRVVVPRDAATRTFEDGRTVTDPRLIGPVYLGLYPGVEEGLLEYVHPEMGPIYQEDIPGDTYPYGGTTVGDIRFACMEFLACKVVSGRHVDFDSMVEWFRDYVGTPVTDAFGNEVQSGEYIRQTCYELMNYTTDDEIRLTVTEDRNEDGVLDGGDLDFIENADGDFEAIFTIHQQDFIEGMSLWGWMDAPSIISNQYSTCDPEDGYQESEYNSNFFGGRQYRDLLNFPSIYISSGDWVSSQAHQYVQVDDIVELRLDYEVEN